MERFKNHPEFREKLIKRNDLLIKLQQKTPLYSLLPPELIECVEKKYEFLNEFFDKIYTRIFNKTLLVETKIYSKTSGRSLPPLDATDNSPNTKTSKEDANINKETMLIVESISFFLCSVQILLNFLDNPSNNFSKRFLTDS